MQANIVIKEASLEEVVLVNATITEFGGPYEKFYFESRLKGKPHLALGAYIGGKAVGYMVAYDRDNDGSFYCWMAGVSPEHRRKGIIGQLMASLEQWTNANGYSWITIKTRNARREMLAYLVKAGFNFTAVEERPATRDNRILLEKRVAKIAG